MNNPAVMKKLMTLESKIWEIEKHLGTIAESVSELAKEQRIIRRKQNEILHALSTILGRLPFPD